mmetsp:Transcript_9502/g.35342  ORF Transcript_9502/g.35342 Transcript_9502/m.35342 type:complete len:488 (-) Transcript_9502:747-2210(-)
MENTGNSSTDAAATRAQCAAAATDLPHSPRPAKSSAASTLDVAAANKRFREACSDLSDKARGVLFAPPVPFPTEQSSPLPSDNTKSRQTSRSSAETCVAVCRKTSTSRHRSADRSAPTMSGAAAELVTNPASTKVRRESHREHRTHALSAAASTAGGISADESVVPAPLDFGFDFCVERRKGSSALLASSAVTLSAPNIASAFRTCSSSPSPRCPSIAISTTAPDSNAPRVPTSERASKTERSGASTETFRGAACAKTLAFPRARAAGPEGFVLKLPSTEARDIGGGFGNSTNTNSPAKQSATRNDPVASVSRSALIDTPPPAPPNTLRHACTPPNLASTTATRTPVSAPQTRASAKYPPPNEQDEAFGSEAWACDGDSIALTAAPRFPPAVFWVPTPDVSGNRNTRVGVPGFSPSGLYDAHTPLDHSSVKSLPSAAAAMTRSGPGPAAASPSVSGAFASTRQVCSTLRPSSVPPAARYSVATLVSV